MDEDRRALLGTPFVARAARWGVVAWTGIGVLVLGYILFQYVIYPVRILFPPLVLALIFVYALNPLVRVLERRGIPRVWASVLTYVLFLVGLGIGLRYLIPVIAHQVTGFVRSLPQLLDRLREWLQGLAARFDVDFDAAGFLNDEGRDAFVDFLGQLFAVTRGVAGGIVIFFLGIILSFYLVVDLPKLQRAAVAAIPARRRPEMMSLADKLGRAVGGFFRGQLLVALFVAVASSLGLFVVGLPYWAVVGLVAGLFNLIPLIGPFIGMVVALFVAFTAPAPAGLLNLQPGWPLAIGSIIALLAVQQIDNHIMSPNIMARSVRVHPITIMLALLAGGTLMGLWGMLLAVPVVASVKILVLHVYDVHAQWPPPSADGAREPTPVVAAAEAPPRDPDIPSPSPPRRGLATARGWLRGWRDRRRRGAAPASTEPDQAPARRVGGRRR